MIRYLDADSSFAGDRRDDPDPFCLQRQRNVVLQTFDLTDLDPGRRHKLIKCNNGPRGHRDAFDSHAKIRKLRSQEFGVRLQLVLIDVLGGAMCVQ